MTSRTEYSTQTPNKPSLFDVQYLLNHRTLDIGVLGYIGIVWPKEQSPEVRSFPPGTPCIHTHTCTYIYMCVCVVFNKAYWMCWYCLLTVTVWKEQPLLHAFPQNTMLFPYLLNLLVLPVIVNFEQFYIWWKPCAPVPDLTICRILMKCSARDLHKKVPPLSVPRKAAQFQSYWGEGVNQTYIHTCHIDWWIWWHMMQLITT